MKTLITAHSGADGTPDNSMEYVDYALKCGTDAFEVDVRRFDSRLAIGHDEVSADAPSLADVFSAAAKHPRIKMNCDLKEPGLEEDVCALAEEAGFLHSGRLILTGTADASRAAKEAEVFLNLEEHVPDLYLNYREIPNFELTAAAQICAVCHKTGARTVNAYQGIITRRFASALAESGIGLSVWTVNDAWELNWFLGLGVKNITTRKAELALRLRNSKI